MLKFISFGSGSSGNCYYLGTARVLITHDHADHIKSVGSFSYEYKVPIYATEKVHKGIDHNYCVTRKVADEMKKEVVVGEPIQMGDFLVRPFHVPHEKCGL